MDATSPMVVGVSGGPDSLCLLHAMHTLGYELVVAHFDHALRSESAADAEKVEQFCKEMGLTIEIEREDTGVYAKENALSIEEAARECRYTFLYKLAERHNAQAVAVGHNADDQVETVLMHLLRGAGLDGLRGMQMHSVGTGWSQTIPLVRPLLSTWRDDILAYCEQNDLEPLFDRSNLDTTYFRNRLRHELLPDLESYNPQVRAQLWRMAETLGGDQQIVEQHIDIVWNSILVEENITHLAVNREIFLKENSGVQRRLLRRALTQLRPGLRDLDFASIQRAIDAIKDPPASGQCDLMAGLRLLVENDQFWLAGWEAEIPVSADWPQIPEGEPCRVDIPGEITVGEGWRLKVEGIAEAETDLDTGDPFQTLLSADNLEDSLLIRGRQWGDRFAPLGMDGHSLKLSDFFINEKLPKRARDGWPLLCAGDEIIWVSGFRPSHRFRVTEATEKMIHLHLYRQKDDKLTN
ncbi:MAG: tRNA lysidine(34) synthetase TilS [Chloroflexi bacterium]|nr:tRNA lysidine(34) synthetase TilS [Chloroflexota bacterium]